MESFDVSHTVPNGRLARHVRVATAEVTQRVDVGFDETCEHGPQVFALTTMFSGDSATLMVETVLATVFRESDTKKWLTFGPRADGIVDVVYKDVNDFKLLERGLCSGLRNSHDNLNSNRLSP